MSDTKNLISFRETVNAPRVRRGAAAVIAQYIQDLTHPSEPAVRATAA